MASQTTANEMQEGAVCIPNISTAQRMKRLRFGILGFVVSAIVLAALVALGLSRWWRLALFPMFAGSAVSVFQWSDKTCVALSAKNTRFTGDHEEAVEDASEQAQIARQARKVQIKGTLSGLAVTLLTLAIPGAW
jgi:hypothetical protein